MNPQDLDELVTRTMPFGKYAGRLLADLTGPYLHWFAREGFPDGEPGLGGSARRSTFMLSECNAPRS